MQEYLDKGLFNEYRSALILMRRTQADGKVRTGLVGAIDLEQYDYNKGSKSQVRATEATVASRIPPRVKIRRDAALELPHIMILIDDVKRTVIEPLEAKRDQLTKLYDFDLMQNGGHLEGWLVDGGHAKTVFDALDKLADKADFNKRYGLTGEDVLLYAMGDGNHSLATAKECYEQKKRANAPEAALARYALAEVVNLHSEALEFEAIHRVITETDAAKLMADMTAALKLTEGASGQSFTVLLDGAKKQYSVGAPTDASTPDTAAPALPGQPSDLPRQVAFQERRQDRLHTRRGRCREPFLRKEQHWLPASLHDQGGAVPHSYQGRRTPQENLLDGSRAR